MDQYVSPRDWESPRQDLREELVSAISSGDKDRVLAALDRQECNATTINLSNHLAVRAFWLTYKTMLVGVSNRIAASTDPADRQGCIEVCLDDLDRHFITSFISDNPDAVHERLSGDDLFREFVVAYPAAATNMVAVEDGELRSPRDFFDDIALKHNDILSSLVNTPAELRTLYSEFEIASMGGIEMVVASQIDVIDKELLDVVGTASNTALL